jgi:hypothetical protein
VVSGIRLFGRQLWLGRPGLKPCKKRRAILELLQHWLCRTPPARQSSSATPKTFAAGHTPDFVVNSPANRVLTGSQPQQGFAAGFIDYHSLDREIDHAAVLPEELVVIMGEETAKPRGAAHLAGKTVRRRFTDLLRNVDGHWQVAVRQSTVIQVE